MKNAYKWFPLVALLVCASLNASELQSLPVISAGLGTTPMQDTSVAVVQVDIKPETLNLGSRGIFTAFIGVGGEYTVKDIDVSTVECAGAVAVRGTVAGDKLAAKFNTEDLLGVTPGGAVMFTVTGQFTDSQWFMGTDVIRVIISPKP